MKELSKIGYVCFRSPGSHGIDVFAVPKAKDTNLPYLAVEVGGPKIRETMIRLKLQAQAAEASGVSYQDFWKSLYPAGDGP
jgi:hypothetical protein